MKIIAVFFVVITFFSFSGCSENTSKRVDSSKLETKEKTNEDMARKHGMLGEIPVYRSEKKPDGKKSVFSPYFSISADGRINFLFRTALGEIVMVDYDSNFYRVVTDAGKNIPTVEIIYQKQWLDIGLDHEYFNDYDYRTTWGIKGPKIYFKHIYPESIIVRISPEDLKREMAFPL